MIGIIYVMVLMDSTCDDYQHEKKKDLKNKKVDSVCPKEIMPMPCGPFSYFLKAGFYFTVYTAKRQMSTS